jgi:hypothetical protein
LSSLFFIFLILLNFNLLSSKIIKNIQNKNISSSEEILKTNEPGFTGSSSEWISKSDESEYFSNFPKTLQKKLAENPKDDYFNTWAKFSIQKAMLESKVK